MIRIHVVDFGGGLEITAVGHADFAPRGHDVVCAGVSAILHSFIAYLEQVNISLERYVRCRDAACGEMVSVPERAKGGISGLMVQNEYGYMRIRTRRFGDMDRHAWRVAEAGLRLIAEHYPTCVSLDLQSGEPEDAESAPHAGPYEEQRSEKGSQV